MAIRGRIITYCTHGSHFCVVMCLIEDGVDVDIDVESLRSLVMRWGRYLAISGLELSCNRV